VSNLRPLSTDLRDHLGELTGNEYKVWTAYYLRTGDYELTSHPSNKTIEKDTGLSNRTVKTAKAGLRAKEWLIYTGEYKQPRLAEGKFAVPVMEVRLPWRPDWSAVVMDVNTAYDAFTTVVQKVTHGTVVQNLHPEGSIGFGFGLGSDLSSSSIIYNKEVERREKTESKPENLEPEPTPTARATPTATARATPTAALAPAKIHYAPDGTPWPEGFDSWRNAQRLSWLEAHGWKQGRMAEASSQKTDQIGAGDRKPTAIAPPLHIPPSSAAPPYSCCPGCDPDFCDCQDCDPEKCICERSFREFHSIETTESKLDNWSEL
jgi:hypothetical protein